MPHFSRSTHHRHCVPQQFTLKHIVFLQTQKAASLYTGVSEQNAYISVCYSRPQTE